jgi:hypothetical protein
MTDRTPAILAFTQIAKALDSAPIPRVPEWALGAVRRRSITFATGFCDDLTRVYWVQSHGMTGDLRIHPQRPDLKPETRFADLGLKDLVLLASVEGGVATTNWAEGVMSWTDWIGFQPYDKYPESGLMRRIGDCMIEFAPSGVYVEDWRFLPSAPGLLVGLRLISETSLDGVAYTRQGGMVIAGDHAICAIARRMELPHGTRAQDYVRASHDPIAAVEQVLDCSVDYAVRRGGVFQIELSTDPRREGMPAHFMAGFQPTATSGLIEQAVEDDPKIRSRLWQIDSLVDNVAFQLHTPVAPDRLAWLEAESDTLVHPVRAALGISI